MAKTKNQQYSSKPKTSIFLCCFGSPLPKKEKPHPISKQKKRISSSWFSWRRIRINNRKSTSKTVPFEASFSDNKTSHYSQERSKSTLLHNYKSQTPVANPPPPTQPPPVSSVTPYYTPTQTRDGVSNDVEEETREQGRATPTRSKRQARRLSLTVQSQTTSKKPKKGRSSYNPVVGMSVLVVTLVIMIFWGRLCAILCTSAWLYFIPRFINKGASANDDDDDPNTKSNDVDLDSEAYKKKVIMEGLLGRNHRGSSTTTT